MNDIFYVLDLRHTYYKLQSALHGWNFLQVDKECSGSRERPEDSSSQDSFVKIYRFCSVARMKKSQEIFFNTCNVSGSALPQIVEIDRTTLIGALSVLNLYLID